MKDILLLSNGHGEDTIAVRIWNALLEQRPSLSGDAWPMVGRGDAFRSRDVPIVGVANELPSAGFATLDRGLFWRDLKAGWVATHLRQWRAAGPLRSHYALTLAVGDIIPLMAAARVGARTVFVGCAKSAYYRSAAYRYNWLETRLMKSHCEMVFPRDASTADELASKGIRSIYRGNPMMDGLEALHPMARPAGDVPVVAALPGTRADAVANAIDMLLFATDGSMAAMPFELWFAVKSDFESAELISRLSTDPRLHGWKPSADASRNEAVLELDHETGRRATFVADRFAETLSIANAAIGMAGTGNEQAVGLGVPLIAIPSKGVQGERFVRMKAEYFGDAALTVTRQPHAIADALRMVLGDGAIRERMAKAGRERMGEPGASAAIAAEILKVLDR